LIEQAFENAEILFSAGPVVFIKCRAVGKWPVEYVTPNIVKLGFQPEKMLTEEIYFSDIIYSEDLERVEAEFEKQAKSEGEYFELEARIVRPDGNICWVFCFVTSVRNIDNSLKHYNVYIRDINEHKKAIVEIQKFNKELESRVVKRTRQLEDALKELREEITVRKDTANALRKAKEEISKSLEKEKELGELKSRLISMISHEYRTPLTVILTSSYLIDEFNQRGDKEKVQNQLNKIRISVSAMTKLLEEATIIGKSEMGELFFQPGNVNLEILCRDLVEEMKLLDKSYHRIEIYSNYELTNIETDAKLIRQILTHLLSNAIKYSPPESKILLDLNHTDKDIIFKITDFGIGLSEKDQKHLFETFYRSDKDIGITAGSGLGLSIVKKCVDVLGGNITFTSEPHKGTSFTVAIPYIRG
jgi:PAS domain S-box-containing protein